MRRTIGQRNLGARIGAAAHERRSLGRVLLSGIVVTAVLVAIPATASAAQSTITVRNETTPPTAPAVRFHLTGPTCGTVATDFTFDLRSGQSQTFMLCDANPSPVSGRFMVVEEVPAGWKLTEIVCDNNDPDPADFLIIDLPAATAKIELSELNEHKSCTFRNAAPQPPAVVTPTPIPSRPITQRVTPTPPLNDVAGVQETAPARVARIAANTVCATRTARVTVRGQSMRDVTLFVNGRRIKTIRVNATTRIVRTSVPIRGNRAQVVSARVRFRNGARARTVRTNARRCAAAQVRPKFTG